MKAQTYKKIYKLLLRLYPAAYRADYGREIVRVQAELRKAYARDGKLGLFWLRLVTDALLQATRVHIDYMLHGPDGAASVSPRRVARGVLAILRLVS